MGLKKQERWHRNKVAFDEIVGDPFATEETIGQYEASKNSTDAKTGQLQKGRGARPNFIDFQADVEKSIVDALKKHVGKSDVDLAKELTLFYNTYITGLEPTYTQQERSEVEQVVGKMLRKRGISPIAKYFTIIKK